MTSRIIRGALIPCALLVSACAGGGGGGDVDPGLPSGPSGPSGPEPGTLDDVEFWNSNGTIVFGSSGAFNDLATLERCIICPPDPATRGANGPHANFILFPKPRGGADGAIGYPLTQSAMEISAAGIRPAEGVNEAGARLGIIDAETGDVYLEIPGLDIAERFTITAPAMLDDGRALSLAVLSGDYLLLGSWGVEAAASAHIAAFVAGSQTPATDVPTSGSATYSGTGSALGTVMTENDGEPAVATLQGNPNFHVSFASGAVNGVLSSMKATDAEGNVSNWNEVALTGTLAGTDGVATINGTTTASTAPSTPFALDGSATGYINGGLFGPNAQELGAVWSLADGHGAALGVLAAGRVTGGGGAGIVVVVDPGAGVVIETGGGGGVGAYSSGSGIIVTTSSTATVTIGEPTP